MSRWVLELDDELLQELLAEEPLLLVDFYADWCGPCKAVAPVVERLAKEYRGRVTFGKLNIDGSRRGAARFGVRSIPTLILFRDGKQVSRVQGYIPDHALRTYLDRYAPPPEDDAPSPRPASPPGRLGRLFRRR